MAITINIIISIFVNSAMIEVTLLQRNCGGSLQSRTVSHVKCQQSWQYMYI